MKRFLLILILFCTSITALIAQEDDGDDGKVRDKMVEYIQERLDLSKDEATKFSPIFLRYFREWRTTLRANKGDNLVLKQKIIDLQLRYRTQFKEVIGESRSNRIFGHQEAFIRELKVIRKERRQNNNSRPLPRNNR